MLLYYIRHGDPIYNPDSLTPLGHAQAEALSFRFATHGFDKIFSSDSNRAVQTAAPTAAALGITPTQLPWCNESRPWERMCVFDDNGIREYCFEDPATRRLFTSDDVRALGDNWGQHPAFTGNGWSDCLDDIRRDTHDFLASLGYQFDSAAHGYLPIAHTNERVALFAHQAFGMAFLSCVLDIPYPLFCTHFDMGHTGVTVIEFTPKDGIVIPRALQVSNDSHLYREGISTRYQNRIDL